MLSSTVPLLRGAIMGILLLSSSSFLFAQDTHFENYDLKPVLVNMSITNIDGKKVVRVTRDTAAKGAEAGAAALFIALLTISYQIAKASFVNPAQSLRSE